MSEDNMDFCNFVFNHEVAMRRLLSLLRQSQSYCTDTECVDELPSITGSTSSSETNDFAMVTMLWLVAALVLYMFRPNSLRNRRDDLEKPRKDEPDCDGRFPPSSPPSVN